MIRSLLACVLLAPLLPPAADGPVGPRGAPLEQDPQRVITWRGCGISKKAFMAHAAEVYEQRTGVRVELSGGGAALGIQAAGEGAADFGGTCRRCLTDGPEGELELVLTQVAWDALAVVVHPSNPVDGLTRDQLVRVLRGEVTNWSELGGEDRPLLVVARKGKSSGVGYMVRVQMLGDPDFDFGKRTLRLESSGPVEKLVEKSAGAIAITGVSSARLRELKLLELDGGAPTAEDIATGTYPYYRPLYLAHAPELDPEQARFRSWILGEEGQAAVAEEGTVTLAQGVALTGTFAHYGDTSLVTNHAELMEAWEAWRREHEAKGVER